MDVKVSWCREHSSTYAGKSEWCSFIQVVHPHTHPSRLEKCKPVQAVVSWT